MHSCKKDLLYRSLDLKKGITNKSIWRMYVWNYNHKKKEKMQIFKLLEPNSNKLVVLNDNTDIDCIRMGEIIHSTL